MKGKLLRIISAVRSALHPEVDGIMSEAVFAGILRQQRAVAERNRHFITMLAFNAEEGHFGVRMAHLLGQILADRLRATDVAGWLDRRTIGILFPHTRVKDATLVAEHICQKMSARGIKLDYKCYLYPQDECGTSGSQRELPVRHNDDSSPSARAGHELSRAGVDVCCSSETRKRTARLVGASSLLDICVSRFPLWKRGLDIALCLFGLTVFGPVMLLIVIGIKIVDPGPVLFRQERIGFKGKRFVLFKFRSMKLNSDTGVHQQYLAQLMKSDASMTKLDKADARLIPFGKIFRASGLDELPQLFNIIKGDMSFVGPRPCVPYEYEQFSPWHKRRCETYPGLTGLWQVSGKNKTTFTEMMRLDIHYGRRQTLKNDLMILVRTIPAVVGQIRETSTARR